MSTQVKKVGLAGFLAAVLCGASLMGPGMAAGDQGETALRGNALGLYQARDAARLALKKEYGTRWTEATDRMTRNFRRLSQSRVRVYYSFTFVNNNNVNHRHGYVLVWRKSNNKPPVTGICTNYTC